MLPWQEAPWPENWHMVAVIHDETWLGNIDTMGTSWYLVGGDWNIWIIFHLWDVILPID